MSVVEAKVTDDATTRVAADLIDIRKGRAVYENRGNVITYQVPRPRNPRKW